MVTMKQERQVKHRFEPIEEVSSVFFEEDEIMSYQECYNCGVEKVKKFSVEKVHIYNNDTSIDYCTALDCVGEKLYNTDLKETDSSVMFDLYEDQAELEVEFKVYTVNLEFELKKEYIV